VIGPDKDDVPFIAVGNDKFLGSIRAGDLIPCGNPDCVAIHEVKQGTENGQPSDIAQFYSCGGKDYLVGIKGRKLK